MKRKTKLFDKMVGPITVYLEEIERLIEFLSKDGAVSFETDEMTYIPTEGDKLPDDKLHWAKLKTHNVAVVFGSKGAHIFQAEDDDERTWAICARTHDYLSEIRNKQWRGNLPVTLGLVASFFAIQWLFAAKQNWITGLALLIIGLGACVMVTHFVVAGIMAPQACVVIPKKRKDSPTFWMKYRDDFAKQAVTAIISGAIGFGIGRLNSLLPTLAPAPTTPPVTQPSSH